MTLGITIVMEVLRAWTPALMLIHGEVAGIPDPIRIATAAVISFLMIAILAPLVVAALGRTSAPKPRDTRRVRLARGIIGPPDRQPLLIAVAGAVILARLGIQVTASLGGQAHVITTTLALVAGLVWLAAIAAAVDRPTAAIGVVAGLGLDAVLHAVLGTVGLVWHAGLFGWLALVALLAAFGWTTWKTVAAEDHAAGSAWVWLVVPPVLALHGIFGTVAHLQAVSGLAEPVAAAVIIGAHLVALLGAMSALSAPSRLVGAVGGGLALLGLGTVLSPGMPFETAPVAAAGHAVLIVGLGVSVAAVGWSAGVSTPVRRATVTSTGMLVFLLIIFGYYASHDVALPFPRAAFLFAAAAMAAAIAVLTRPVPPTRAPEQAKATPGMAGAGTPANLGVAATRPSAGPSLAVVLALAGLLVIGSAALRPAIPDPVPGDGFPVRIGMYNLHMGYDTSGRLAVDELAAVIESLEADVVGLQEVDRGWFVTGGVDILPRVAERVGMHYVFGAAADEVWGNAILSRHPIVDWWVDPLPLGGAVMSRSVTTAIIDVGGREVVVMSAHLSAGDGETDAREAQSNRLAGLTRSMIDSRLPVVLVGDFNAPPRAREFDRLRSVMTNVTASLGNPPTWPSWDPRNPIDHIYVSPDLQAGQIAVPRSLASDHLAVAVTVQRVE